MLDHRVTARSAQALANLSLVMGMARVEGKSMSRAIGHLHENLNEPPSETELARPPVHFPCVAANTAIVRARLLFSL